MKEKWTGWFPTRLIRTTRIRGAHEINHRVRELERERQLLNMYLLARIQTTGR